jgi:hypothetical protein
MLCAVANVVAISINKFLFLEEELALKALFGFVRHNQFSLSRKMCSSCTGLEKEMAVCPIVRPASRGRNFYQLLACVVSDLLIANEVSCL